MPCLTHLASLPFSDSELTFFKFAAYLVTLLWICYLAKELFFHRDDPRVELVLTKLAESSAAIAATNARIEAVERRQNELIVQQRSDTALLFKEIKDYNTAVQDVLREHEHSIATKGNRPR